MGMRKSSDALMLLILLAQCSCCWLLLTTLLHQEHMEPLIMVHEIEHHVQLMSAVHASEMHSSQVHAELKQTKKRVQPFELHPPFAVTPYKSMSMVATVTPSTVSRMNSSHSFIAKLLSTSCMCVKWKTQACTGKNTSAFTILRHS